jgi:hypothetical protein
MGKNRTSPASRMASSIGIPSLLNWFVKSTNKMVFWCSLGVILRCALFTAIGYYGLKLF